MSGEYFVDNFYLLILKKGGILAVRDEQLASKYRLMRSLNRGVDCSNGAEFRNTETPISLSARRVLFLIKKTGLTTTKDFSTI